MRWKQKLVFTLCGLNTYNCIFVLKSALFNTVLTKKHFCDQMQCANLTSNCNMARKESNRTAKYLLPLWKYHAAFWKLSVLDNNKLTTWFLMQLQTSFVCVCVTHSWTDYKITETGQNVLVWEMTRRCLSLQSHMVICVCKCVHILCQPSNTEVFLEFALKHLPWVI